MGDTYIHLVPLQVRPEEQEEIKSRVMNHLISEKIIEPFTTDCVLGSEGHPPGRNYQAAILDNDTSLLQVLTNGMAVASGERTVFYGGGPEEVNCPRCGANNLENDWGEKLSEWEADSGEDQMTCHSCAEQSPVTDYGFVPAWGFGTLGFTFWNWPGLKPELIEELAIRAGKPIRTVSGKL